MKWIVLDNPKHAYNVGAVLRIASCYGFERLYWTGERVNDELSGLFRIPREERMKGYSEVAFQHHPKPLTLLPKGMTPVAIEVRENSEPLHWFYPPDDVCYVFGPEDGSISAGLIAACHRFVVIPTAHCLNLSVAVGTVAWHHEYLGLNEGKNFTTPGSHEGRGVVDFRDR